MILSVIILTFNQKETTRRCLETVRAVFKQRGWSNNDAEIIVIDNGSTDGSITELTSTFPTVKYKYLEQNIGVAPGRNKGIELAQGRILLILDNDTIITTDAISGLIAHLDSNPKCAIAAPRLTYPDGTCQQSFKEYPGIWIKTRNILCGKRKQIDPPTNIIHPCYVMGACQIFRKQLINEIGLLDDRIFYGPEDADFCLRASAAGYTIDYIPHLSIIHDHRHITRTSPFSHIARRHIRSLFYFYYKHKRWF